MEDRAEEFLLEILDRVEPDQRGGNIEESFVPSVVEGRMYDPCQRPSTRSGLTDFGHGIVLRSGLSPPGGHQPS